MRSGEFIFYIITPLVRHLSTERMVINQLDPQLNRIASTKGGNPWKNRDHFTTGLARERREFHYSTEFYSTFLNIRVVPALYKNLISVSKR